MPWRRAAAGASAGPRRPASLLLALALVAGCGGHAPPKADAARVKEFAGRGYLGSDDYNVVASFATWETGTASHELAITVPAKPGRYPLLIYLPALGETRSAGAAWRTAWTRAGYAVLSVQPLREDARAWSSERARGGDFALLARERYSGAAMSERLAALHAVLEQLVRRQAAGEAPLERIDLSRVALAGYDLGAYTAMVAAGENPRDVVVPTWQVDIRAVVAISPYATFSGASFESRFGAIRLPVLSVTSDVDADALGVVASPSLRRAPFEYMPAGDKFLAILRGLPHATLSGAGEPAEGEAGGAGGRLGRRGGAADDGEARPSPTARAIGVAAIQGLSTAFLDAVLKDDVFAREWLQKDAARWLRDRGELRRK